MRLFGGSKSTKKTKGSTKARDGARANQRTNPRTVRYNTSTQRVRSESTRTYYRPTENKPETLSNGRSSEALTRIQAFVAFVRSPKFPSVILIAVFAVLAIFGTTLSSTVAIQSDDASYQYRDPEEYQQTANRLLSDVGPIRSKLLFRSSTFESDFRAEFPELDAVTALLPLGGRDLTLQIRASEPLAAVQSPTGSARILNETGALVELERHSSDTQSLPVITLDTEYAQSLVEGSQVLTAAEVELVRLIRTEFTTQRRSDVGIEGIERFNLSIADGELRVYLKGVPYYIKFSSYSGVEQQVGAAIATLEDLTKNNEPPLEYVDARVPGRVFVK